MHFIISQLSLILKIIKFKKIKFYMKGCPLLNTTTKPVSTFKIFLKNGFYISVSALENSDKHSKFSVKKKVLRRGQPFIYGKIYVVLSFNVAPYFQLIFFSFNL